MPAGPTDPAVSPAGEPPERPQPRSPSRRIHLRTAYLGFPLWAWISLAAGSMVCAVGLGAALLYNPGRTTEQTVAEGPSPMGIVEGFEEEEDILGEGQLGEQAPTEPSRPDTPGRHAELHSPGGAPGPTASGTRPSSSGAGRSPGRSHSRSGTRRTAAEAAQSFRMEFAPPKVAETLEEIKQAVVKFVIPLPDGKETGAGFFIDGRGWVATNYHVVEHANSATKAVLANGVECRLAGVVAKAPEYDLAIVQLEERPLQLTVLDIKYDGRPKLGAEVFAFGHPYGVDFSLSKGIVSRVVTTGELEDHDPDHLVVEMNSPGATVWIQHTAKISPGNSGGPLLDDKSEVVGVNTFIHIAAEYGFASHVRYLRELLEKADESGKLTPLPGVLLAAFPEDPYPESRPGPVVVSVDAMKELYAMGQMFKLRPKSDAQYELLAGLAKMIGFAKWAQAHPPRDPPLTEETLKKMADAADDLFGKLANVKFTSAEMQAVNRFAARQMSPGAGTLFFGQVLAVFPQETPPAEAAPNNVPQLQLEDIAVEDEPADTVASEDQDGDRAAPDDAASEGTAPEGTAPEDTPSDGAPHSVPPHNTPQDHAAEDNAQDAASQDAADQDAADQDAAREDAAEDAEPQGPALKGMLMQLEGTPAVVFVPHDDDQQAIPKGSRWLVAGMVSFSAITTRDGNSQEHMLPVVVAPYLSPRQ